MLYFFLLLFLLGAAIAPFLYKITRHFAGLILSLIPLALLIWVLLQFPIIKNGDAIYSSISWIPELNINLSTSVDGLSYIFLLIISFIGTLILVYSSAYFHSSKELKLFFPILMLFTAAMLGVVVADNFVILFISWELTSICSFLLIGFEHKEKESREAAWKALVITATGGLGLLGGLIILGSLTGTFSISEIVASNILAENSNLVIAALILILFGAFTKSAQYPFHSWLPSAMAAPTPVSAYLHSATMVQAGVYLLFRVYPIFNHLPEWQILLMIFGGVSMVLAGLKAIGQKDLKSILAYATISALGIIIFLIGLGTKSALKAAMTFMILHAVYKGGLFLVAGLIDKTFHTRDISKLSGLVKVVPFVAVAGFLLAASNAGIFPFLGYIGKELIYEATIHSNRSFWYTISAVLANIGIVATAFMTGVKPFLGSKSEDLPKNVSVRPDFLLPPLILGLVGLGLGIFPAFTSDMLVLPSLKYLPEGYAGEKLKLWHGFNIVFATSLITIAAGVGAYFIRKYFNKADKAIVGFKLINTNYLYEKAFSGLFSLAKFQTKWLQHGYLRWYMFFAILFLLFLAVPSALKLKYPNIDFSLDLGYSYFVYATGAVIVFSGLVSVTSKTTLMSLAALGVVGYGLSLIFVFLGAPDLAITQFAVETLTVILLILVVYRLPKLSSFSGKIMNVVDIIISVASGALVTFLILMVADTPSPARISSYYLENSYLLAKGKNIVNVILVDFRAMDTMGETLVLATAGLGVYILLKLRLNIEDET